MAILDLGLSITLNRELAKSTSENKSVKDLRDLTFSLECIYWSIGLAVSLLIVLLSGFVANHWVKAEHLPLPVVKQSVMLMGVVVAFQWPITLYNGGLIGLNKQVLNNIIIVIMSTLRAAGVLFILHFFSATLQSFFLWQAGLSFLFVFVLRWALWKEMPGRNILPQFSKKQLRLVWRFAAGMTGITLVTFFLMQVDKIIISKILPLTEFGYYMLAFNISTVVGLIVAPLSTTFFPRFANLIAKKKEDELKNTYNQACKIMSSFVFPVCFVLIFFMPEILQLWTHNITTTQQVSLIAQILVAGSLCNALMVIPYHLMLAFGQTRFTIYQNAIASILLVPMLFLLANQYGAVGAACVWLILNASYILISIPLIHRMYMKGELSRWYWNNTLLPMLPSLTTIFILNFFWNNFFPGSKMNWGILAFISLLTFVVSITSIIKPKLVIRALFNLK